MTKKDYELIANVIYFNLKKDHQHTYQGIITMIVDDLARELKKDNPDFNATMFYEACGIEAV